MTNRLIYDPARERSELREQLASDKRRIAFLLGAGTSMAVGMPGMAQLTQRLPQELSPPWLAIYSDLLQRLGPDANIEAALTRIRLCREIVSPMTPDSLDSGRICAAHGDPGMSATDTALACPHACPLDRQICRSIAKILSEPPPKDSLPQRIFAQWLRTIPRDYPIEVFTTNYDLLLEMAMEDVGTYFFDGFVGSVEPFFAPSTVEADARLGTDISAVPRTWVRLWKLHGSIGWRRVKTQLDDSHRIARAPLDTVTEADEYIIFPSHEKYSDSRKLPFVAYHDRLRTLLLIPDVLLIVAGYSFADQHINEIILQCLRANSSLAVTVLLHDPATPTLARHASQHRNLTVYDPINAYVGTVKGDWHSPQEPPLNAPPAAEGPPSGVFTLGHFSEFAQYLASFLGSSVTVHSSPPEPPMPPTPPPPGDDEAPK